LAPPTGLHLDVLRIVAGAEGKELDAVRARLDVPHRVTVEANRVPFADLDDLVVDLDPRRATHDDVDLFLCHVLVAERNAEARGERQQAQTERLAADRSPAESRLELGRHPELRRLVLDLSEIRLPVAHSVGSRPAGEVRNSAPHVEEAELEQP